MNADKFNEFLSKGDIEQKQPTVVVTCTGASERILGMADIFMHFKGENGTKMTFELNIVVHPTINQDFLLGRDFTGSDFKVAETNSHIYLSQNYAI